MFFTPNVKEVEQLCSAFFYYTTFYPIPLNFAVMLFSNIIGQNATKNHLTELVKQNRLSHALLFLGKEGSGALPLAIAFAQYIVSLPTDNNTVVDMFGNTTNNSADGVFIHPDEVGNNPATQHAFNRAAQLQHPDLHFTFPVITRKSGEEPVSSDYIALFRDFVKNFPYGNAFDWLQSIGTENKQGNITSKECNEIIKKLSLKTFESSYKILVLWMPEYLGEQANKLLKLIEEPPPNTLFFLVAENDEKLLPTIVSRCQLIKVPLLDNEDVSNALINKNNIATAIAIQIANMANGNYREAILLSQNAYEDWFNLLKDWLNACVIHATANAEIAWIDEIAKMGRENQKQFLQYINHVFSEVIKLQALGEAHMQLAPYEQEFAKRLSRILNYAQCQAIIEMLDKATYYVERNANAKILFHALCIKLRGIYKDKIVILTE